jgi:hypothetical protein
MVYTRHAQQPLVHCALSTASLVVASAGAGILSFPWALSLSRLPAFLAGGSCVICACAVGMVVLSERALERGDAYCYERIVERAFGARTAQATAVAIILQQIGSMVGFLVAISDFTSAALSLPAAPVLVALALALLWPLSLVPSLQSLWLPSLLSIASVVAVSGAVVARALGGGSCPARGAHASDVALELMVPPTSAGALLQVVPILVFGFNGHLQTPLVAAELRRSQLDHASRERVMLGAVACTLTVCAALYASTAVAGVACYGARVRNDILANLGTAASAVRPHSISNRLLLLLHLEPMVVVVVAAVVVAVAAAVVVVVASRTGDQRRGADARPVIEPSTDARPAIEPSTDARPAIEPSTDARPAIKPSTDARPVIEPSTDARPVIKPSRGQHMLPCCLLLT